MSFTSSYFAAPFASIFRTPTFVLRCCFDLFRISRTLFHFSLRLFLPESFLFFPTLPSLFFIFFATFSSSSPDFFKHSVPCFPICFPILWMHFPRVSVLHPVFSTFALFYTLFPFSSFSSTIFQPFFKISFSLLWPHFALFPRLYVFFGSSILFHSARKYKAVPTFAIRRLGRT